MGYVRQEKNFGEARTKTVNKIEAQSSTLYIYYNIYSIYLSIEANDK